MEYKKEIDKKIKNCNWIICQNSDDTHKDYMKYLKLLDMKYKIIHKGKK